MAQPGDSSVRAGPSPVVRAWAGLGIRRRPVHSILQGSRTRTGADGWNVEAAGAVGGQAAGVVERAADTKAFAVTRFRRRNTQRRRTDAGRSQFEFFGAAKT